TKVPSTPKDLLEGIGAATRRILDIAGAKPADVERFIHGTTVATNAILEQKGAVEDPLNAWMWKCRIEGAADGLLKGKTVSFKDHIAIAGMPMSFGSFALEGFVPDFDATVVTRVLEAGGTITGTNVMNVLRGGFVTGA